MLKQEPISDDLTAKLEVLTATSITDLRSLW